jgi:predicted molibdopterin-dependent oxidoreductase YjgC
LPAQDAVGAAAFERGRKFSMMKITINGSTDKEAGEPLVAAINRVGKELPKVCYHPQSDQHAA